MKKINSGIYFITDSGKMGEDEFLKRIESALCGGVSLIQLREKERSTKEYIRLAEKVHKISQKYSVPLIIDDRVDVCLAAGAEGVHLGKEDMSVETARAILGSDKIIGATAKTVESAVKAYEMGADYLGVGAIYPTTTKVKTIITSVETLSNICREVPIPVFAIGGLNDDNIGILKGAEIAGVCAVSAIMRADSPELAVINLKKALEEIK